MAWTPTPYLLKALFDNRRPGLVCGWIRFAGVPLLVLVELRGDLAEDVRGRRVVLAGPGDARDRRAARGLAGFALRQTGTVTRMTAGRPSMEALAHFEWCDDTNGPIVLELDPYQVHVVGEPMLFRPRVAQSNVPLLTRV